MGWKMEKPLVDNLTDVTIREGSQQSHDLRHVSSITKVEILKHQLSAGLRSIELTAFAPGEWFSDADELAELSKPYADQIHVRGLYFNLRGAERLKQFPYLEQLGIFHTAATETYRKKNYNQGTVEVALSKLDDFLNWFAQNGFQFDVFLISTAFGDKQSGVLSADESYRCISTFLERAAVVSSLPRQITLADTEGVSSSSTIRELVSLLKVAYPDQELCLHLHPAPHEAEGLIRTALELGIRRWEGAWFSMGGSPLADSPGGNMDIQTLIEVYEQQGLETGFNLEGLSSLKSYLHSLRKS